MKQFIASVFILCAIISPELGLAAGFAAGNAIAQFEDTDHGTLNFAPANGGVDVDETTGLTGTAWGDVAGWIQFDGVNYGVDVTCVGDTATLSGYAWGQTAGWVNFGPFNNNTADQVTIDADGYFDGSAWSQNFGWITFDSSVCSALGGAGNDETAPGLSGGCVQTDFQCTTPGGGGGGGGPSGPSCSLSVSPAQIAQPNQLVTLSWAISGDNPTFTLLGHSYTSSGAYSVFPTHTTTYTGTITDANGTSTCHATVVVSQTPSVLGCTDPAALNYNTLATVDNGVCVYEPALYPLSYTGIIPAPNSSQCNYFKSYLRRGDRGIEVAKVQRFLNTYNGEHLRVDGVFGQETFMAVHRFQARHYDDIIEPWTPPMPPHTTGWWYKTTMGTANIIVGCPADDVYLETPRIVHSFQETLRRLYRAYYALVNRL